MTTTIECQPLVYGQASGMTAVLFPPGSDTAVVPDSPIVLTEYTNQHGVYHFAAPTVSSVQILGVYRVYLYLSGATLPFFATWVGVLASGVCRGEDSYVAALFSMAIDGSSHLIVSPTNIVSALAGATIVIVSPLSQDGAILNLTTGDSYTAERGTSFTFNIANAPGLVGTVPHLRITGQSSDLAVAPAIISQTQQIVFNDVLASATIGLSVGTYPYQIRFEESPDVATIIQGYATVRAGI